jgi:hypothetical protein
VCRRLQAGSDRSEAYRRLNEAQVHRVNAVPRNPKLPSLEGLLSDEERDAILNARATAPFHPLSVLLRGESPITELIAANTERAARQVKRRNNEWLQVLKKRLLQTKPLTEPASALAELRAYGDLLEAGLDVSPIPTNPPGSKPDFKVNLNGEELQIEVHAKQHDEAMADEIESFHRTTCEQSVAKAASVPGPSVRIDVKVVQPFGKPRPGKPGDTTRTNAISKVSQIKDDEHQFSEEVPALLWLDLQDAQNLGMALIAEDLSPVISWQGFVNSGVLWYALYGWKGAPVFERHCLLIPFVGRSVMPMQHDGRFRRSTKLSAVLISFPNATMLAESFRATAPISDAFRRHFPGLPWAHIPSSIINWIPNQVKETISTQACMICAMAGDGYDPPA